MDHRHLGVDRLRLLNRHRDLQRAHRVTALKANSYPYLVAGISDGQLDGPKGPESITIELLNNGVGPANE